jgi:radical SAM superfamily enzyme YgiQ (UPF0313 family)
MRARTLRNCLNEIVEAKKLNPAIEVVTITDDCPSFDKDRFKEFLEMFRQTNLGCELTVDNMRADLIDDEMINLYKAAGGRNVCLGVESGHPEVFESAGKRESLEEIIHAARVIRKYGLSLGLCFVIGLPWDNLKRHAMSIKLAKALKPDYAFWNMCIPWPGTRVHEWYQINGEIRDLCNFSTLIDPRVNFKEPVATSYEFPKEDRIRAWLMANMETVKYFRALGDVKKLFLLTIRYKLYRSFAIYFLTLFIPEAFCRAKKMLKQIAGQ